MSTYSTIIQRLGAILPILGVSEKRVGLVRLESLAENPDLWQDQGSAVTILAEVTSLKTFLARLDELEEFLGMGEESLSETDLASLEKEVEYFEQLAVFAGEHDQASALLTIHAGTGGVDAQDWAEILMRMFLRYAEQGSTEQVEDRTLSIDRSNWKVEILELTPAEEAGIKKAVMEIRGNYSYGLLQAEAGVHRLVRLSPFNAKNLRQTSFALVEIIPVVDQAHGISIDEKELRIDVYRASGKGGQGVNTTDSAVRITHIPSGIVVAVQNERSQHQNKATAMKILTSKLARLQELKNHEEAAMLKGEFKEGSWGNQICSYVMQPYQLVKDHRTDFETSNIQKVLDGDIGPFIQAYLTNKPN
jgi:peptide chain release factor 2